ncbi:MAG: hypothetical protein CO128_01915 [Ignavibacteriales bacterium CG_4_9_14_3_um_filter_30_11]|nr:MAG: hypothetical protein CO128_01915 [Ignavibacteriales bacterium CG_4_9_14_3_um_filter_30_11]
MINRLKVLYELQNIDDQLDDLEELRGDLPKAVEDLEAQIESIKSTISEKEQQRKESMDKRKENESQIEISKESQKKFKAQLYKVRNNKEYDALTKEIDHTEELIAKYETENNELADMSKTLADEIETIKPKLDELNEEVKKKQSDLKVIIKANEKEEEKLNESRKKLVTQIKKGDLSAYMRIRKAKKGKAVSTIKRSACSGCHNIVPSQRQLELRQNNRLYYCEYCGRILVSAEVSESVAV